MEQLDINQHNNDTICAVSTPAGVGGIAVVRVSGRDAVKCVMKSWRGADLNAVQTHTLHLGRIVDTDGETLDEVVAAVFRGPRSFTGEDVIELSCHGSLWVQQQLVALLIGNGCRAAEGGECSHPDKEEHCITLVGNEGLYHMSGPKIAGIVGRSM